MMTSSKTLRGTAAKIVAKKAVAAAATKLASDKKAALTDMAKKSPVQMKKVSKKTAYDIKEASNPKMKASARKHYAMNAQAAMKNKKK